MSDLAVRTKDYAPMSLAGLCVNWDICTGQAGPTGFCRHCCELQVRWYVGKLRTVDAFESTTAEWFLDEVASAGAVRIPTLEEARELRIAVGRAMNPLLALDLPGLESRVRRDPKRANAFWAGLPQHASSENPPVRRMRRRIGIGDVVVWLVVAAALGAACWLVWNWVYLTPQVSMDFYWDSSPAAAQPVVYFTAPTREIL